MNFGELSITECIIRFVCPNVKGYISYELHLLASIPLSELLLSTILFWN